MSSPMPDYAAALAAIQRIRELHKPWTDDDGDTTCEVCALGFPAKWTYPCATIAILNGEQE